MRRLIIGIIKLYQGFISPLFPRSCRFYPTCSNYTILALEKYGVLKGLSKAVGRIVKCHPFHKGGYDPLI
ncbi:MAG: membrane protein insertion efficiency factor YidD [Clostridiales bacterium]|nr:membrane protein insertion efficiency factor YidD [Clostridiales bacterium]